MTHDSASLNAKPVIVIVDPDPDCYDLLRSMGFGSQFDIIRVLSSASGLNYLNRRKLACLILATDAPDARRSVDLWGENLLQHRATCAVLVAPSLAPSATGRTAGDPAAWLLALGKTLRTPRPVNASWIEETLAPALGVELPLQPVLSLAVWPTAPNLSEDESDAEPGFDGPCPPTNPAETPPPFGAVARSAVIRPQFLPEPGLDGESGDTGALEPAELAEPADEQSADGDGSQGEGAYSDGDRGDTPWVQLAAARIEREAAVARLQADLRASETTVSTLQTLLQDAWTRAVALEGELKRQSDLRGQGDPAAPLDPSEAIETVREEYQRALEEQVEAWEQEREHAVAEHDALRQRIESLQAELEARTGSAHSMDSSLAQSEQSGERAPGPGAEGAEQAERLLAAEAELEAIRSQMMELREATERDRARRASFDEACAQHQLASEALEAERAASSALRAELEEAHHLVSAAEERLSAMFVEVQLAQAKAAELAPLQELLVEAEHKIEELSGRCTRLEAALAAEEESTGRFRTAAAERAREEERLKAELVALQAAMQAEREAAPPIPPPLPPAASQEQFDQLKQQLAAVREALASSEAELRAETKRWQQTEAERARLAAELVAARAVLPPPVPADSSTSELERLRAALEAAHRQRAEWVAERKRLIAELAAARSQLPGSAGSAPAGAAPPPSRRPQDSTDAVDRMRAEMRTTAQSIRVCLMEIEHGRERIDAHRQQLLARKASHRALMEAHRQLQELLRDIPPSASALWLARISGVVEQMKNSLRDSRMLVDSAETLSAAQEALIQRLYAALTRRGATGGPA